MLTCPACASQYERSDGLGVVGQSVRCGHCTHVWRVSISDVSVVSSTPGAHLIDEGADDAPGKTPRNREKAIDGALEDPRKAHEPSRPAPDASASQAVPRPSIGQRWRVHGAALAAALIAGGLSGWLLLSGEQQAIGLSEIAMRSTVQTSRRVNINGNRLRDVAITVSGRVTNNTQGPLADVRLEYRVAGPDAAIVQVGELGLNLRLGAGETLPFAAQIAVSGVTPDSQATSWTVELYVPDQSAERNQPIQEHAQ